MKKSIFFREEPHKTPGCRQIKDLDSLPMPDRSLVDYDKYSKYIGLTMARNTLSIQGTRGCPYLCAYCHKIWPKTHVYRSAEHIFDEVMFNYKIGVRRFAFIDDVFNLKIKNCTRFLQLIIKHCPDLQLFFPGGLRVDIMSPELIDLMVEAGTVNFCFALETASPRLQKLIGKNLNLDRMREVSRYICKKHPQVILELHTMHGFPTETEAEAMMTLEFIKSFQWYHFPYVNILKIYPNTDMARLALENGVPMESIMRSEDLAWHQLPETLPFDKSFTLNYQADFLNDYFLKRERLLHVLPHQMKVLTEPELLQKYDSYLPDVIHTFPQLVEALGLETDDLKRDNFPSDNYMDIAHWHRKNNETFPKQPAAPGALRLLLLDLSQQLTQGSDHLFDTVVEPPLGLIYLLTYLNRRFGDQINGKIGKAMIDFNSYAGLKQLIHQFKPDIIGIRSLTFYKEFFHEAVAKIRQWGFDGPLLAGGPYATSDYDSIFQDTNVDVVAIGEGENTLTSLLEAVMANNNQLPCEEILKSISGIAFIPGGQKRMRLAAMDNDRAELVVAASQKTTEKNYWLETLAGDWRKSSFPEDTRQPLKHSGFSGFTRHIVEAEPFRVDGALYQRLSALSKDNDKALHIILEALLVVLLNVYTGNDDILLGTPVYRRENEHQLINTVLPLRTTLHPQMTFKELLIQSKQLMVDAVKHQAYPVDLTAEQLGRTSHDGQFPLFDVAFLLENIQDGHYLLHIQHNMLITFQRSQTQLDGTIRYNTLLYRPQTIKRIIAHFSTLMQWLLDNIDQPLANLELLTAHQRFSLLQEMNHSSTDFADAPVPRELSTIHSLFRHQAAQSPLRTALVSQDEYVTYEQLERRSNQLAHFLVKEKHITPEDRIALILDKSPDMVAAILGVLKAGAAYIPLGTRLPRERLRKMLNDADVGLVITQHDYARLTETLQWETPCLHSFILLDSDKINALSDAENEELSNQERLWNYVGETAVDEITGGGWLTSYTGQPFTQEEMNEYGDNVLEKLLPILTPRTRVLEIGCASGLSMYRIAPRVKSYYGTDISQIIIEKNKARVIAEGRENIQLACLPAHNIGTLAPQQFDLVIINSVIQSFPSHNYLRGVVASALALLSENGNLYLGDIMDQDLKTALVKEMQNFKRDNAGKGYLVKTDWDAELFISRSFINDLRIDFPLITDAHYSLKIHTIGNELTKFRYDALLHLDKTKPTQPAVQHRHKHRHGNSSIQQQPSDIAVDEAGPENAAYIIYTSGTTGIPKGVMTEHRAAANVLKWFACRYPLLPQQRVIQLTEYTFDPSVEQIFSALMQGACVLLASHRLVGSPEEFRKFVETYNGSIINFVPSALKYLLPWDQSKIPDLDIIISGGEPLDNPLKERLIREGYTLHNHYGPTETTIDALAHQCEAGVPVALGKPIANTRCYILGKDNQLVPPGVYGHLHLAGTGLARGYMNDPQLTAEKFITHRFQFRNENNDTLDERLYRTGDLARWTVDGTLQMAGRIDQQVKIRGYRIELAEIESQLMTHPHLKEAVVITADSPQHDGEEGSKYLCAYYVPTAESDVESAQLHEFLAGIVPDYMIPSYFVSLNEIPRTTTGKLDRKSLPDHQLAASGDYNPPADAVEESLVRLWAEILSLEKERISVDANFFGLGGHSLKATILVSKVHKAMDVKLPLAEVFKAPTVKGMAAYIKQASRETFTAILPASKSEYYPLSSPQKRLFIHQQMNKDAVLYNMPEILILDSDADIHRLNRTFRKIIERHEIFRTSFDLVAGQPVQVVHNHVPFEITELELPETVGGKQANGEPKPINFADDLIPSFVKPFNLAQPPLLRAGIYKIKPSKYILLVDIHHIICDAVSHQIFERDFSAIYNGKHLTPLKLQYKDFSCWQNRLLNQEAMNRQKEYWLAQFSNGIPRLSMPLDYPRPALQNFDGGLIQCNINADLTTLLNQLILNTGTTLYIMMLALYSVLLIRYTGNEEVIVGSPISGRRHDDLEGIIGMFVNMLAIRNKSEAQMTFLDFLAEVKTNALNAYENQDYPFDELVSALGLQGDLSRNPLFDAAFTFQNVDDNKDTAGDDADVKNSRTVSRFDLHLVAQEAGDKISLYLEYATALFTKATAAKMTQRFLEIVTQVLDDPHVKIRNIRLSHDLMAAKADILKDETESFRF